MKRILRMMMLTFSGLFHKKGAYRNLEKGIYDIPIIFHGTFAGIIWRLKRYIQGGNYTKANVII